VSATNEDGKQHVSQTQELAEITISQFSYHPAVGNIPRFISFKPKDTKTRNGGLRSFKNSDTQPVKFFDAAVNKLNAYQVMDDLLSCLPRESYGNKGNRAWLQHRSNATVEGFGFYNRVLGKSILGRIVSEIIKFSGVATGSDLNFTNHSLRAGKVVTMKAAGAEDRYIIKETGHTSVESLNSYDHLALSSELELQYNNFGETGRRDDQPPPIKKQRLTEAGAQQIFYGPVTFNRTYYGGQELQQYGPSDNATVTDSVVQGYLDDLEPL